VNDAPADLPVGTSLGVTRGLPGLTPRHDRPAPARPRSRDIAKARTAAIFRRPSKVFEDQVKNGRVSALALPGAAALQGGLPIVHRGRVIGAIGVSGNTPQEDEDIAKIGASVLSDR